MIGNIYFHLGNIYSAVISFLSSPLPTPIFRYSEVKHSNDKDGPVRGFNPVALTHLSKTVLSIITS